MPKIMEIFQAFLGTGDYFLVEYSGAPLIKLH